MLMRYACGGQLPGGRGGFIQFFPLKDSHLNLIALERSQQMPAQTFPNGKDSEELYIGINTSKCVLNDDDFRFLVALRNTKLHLN